MSESRIIERRLAPMDERMPLAKWHEISREQADSVPLEIAEDGITYEWFSVRCEIKGYMNTAIALYREKQV